MLKRGEARHHWDDGITQGLRQLVRSAQRSCQKIRGLDDVFDDRATFGAIALEQPVVAATVQDQIKLPDQVPHVMQSGIHPLPTEGTVNVRGVAGDEDTADAHLSDLPVMDAKVA